MTALQLHGIARRVRESTVILLVALFLTPALALAAEAQRQPSNSDAIRGIHLSTHGIGYDWGSDAIEPTLDALVEIGANWVAIHPYARISADGSVQSRMFDGSASEGARVAPEFIARPIREAHERGLKVFIKPHLAYWGSSFSWRGEIEFETDEQWQRFFREYERWIVAVAAASAGADGFAIGTELDRTIGYDREWRQIIASARAVSDIPLTYAANWTDYRRVGFWDVLDIIGIQAYFPVATQEDAPADEIRAGWQTVMGELRAFAHEQGRDIVFTEMGYNRSFSAAMRPWEYRRDGASAEAHQLRCMDAALDAIEGEDLIRGAFLWKWFPEPRAAGRDFRLAAPAMRAKLRGRWAKQH